MKVQRRRAEKLYLVKEKSPKRERVSTVSVIGVYILLMYLMVKMDDGEQTTFFSRGIMIVIFLLVIFWTFRHEFREFFRLIFAGRQYKSIPEPQRSNKSEKKEDSKDNIGQEHRSE